MTNKRTNREASEECEANIAYFRGMLESLSCRDEEYEANHAYYNAELKAWKEREEEINKVNGVSNSSFINTVMDWAN